MKRIILGILGTFLVLYLACDILLSWGTFLYLSHVSRPSFSTEKFKYSPMLSLALHINDIMHTGETTTSEPTPYNTHDPLQGYGPKPATYRFTISSPHKDKPYRWSATILKDFSRATAPSPVQGERTVYIYGDSWVFGWGMDDENSMAWHLQTALRDKGWGVRNFAQAGYSTINALLRHRTLKDSMTENDVVIMGYANFYKERNVADPGWIKALSSGLEKLPPEYEKNSESLLYPRGRVTEDGVSIDYVGMYCPTNDGYCDKPAIGDEERDRVINAMHDELLDSTRAKFVVLFISGRDGDPAIEHLRQRGVMIVDARPRTADSFVLDSIYGYDDHPGPLFHRHMFRKVLDEVFTKES